VRTIQIFSVVFGVAVAACGGDASEPAKAGPAATATAPADAPNSASAAAVGDAVPSAAWDAIGANVEARFAELDAWADENSIDPKKDGEKIRAMKMAVAAKTAAPAWLEKSSWHDKEADVLFGVGMVSGIKNASLALSTAENRARAEIAKLLQTTVQQEKNETGSTTRTFTAVTLSGVRLVDWYQTKDGTLAALAAMPPAPK